MPGTNDNNQVNDNSIFVLGNQPAGVVSPDQTTMFAETSIPVTADVTRMEIPHSETTPAAPTATVSTSTSKEEVSEVVSSGTKLKILATLAIVGLAGYAAYWVQEPVQLKTDVISGTSTPVDVKTDSATSTPVTDSSATPTDSTTTPATPADSKVAAAVPATPADAKTTDPAVTDAATSPSVSIDVSLFGFNPATLTIDKGTTVVWTNTSTADQTIIGSAPDGESFSSPVLTSGQYFSFKFDQDADFQYYSTYNPALKASIKVGTGSPAEVAATATAPADAVKTVPTTPADIGGPADNNAVVSAPVPTLYLPSTTGLSSNADLNTASADQLKPAATEITPKKLSKTGPAEDLYALMLLGVAWMNRKKLMKAFKK